MLFVGTEPGDGLLRIGELSRRVGVSDHVLRAWERRYGLLKPVRSAGGFRLYSEADEGRVRRMQAHLAGGLSAAEAARATGREGIVAPATTICEAEASAMNISTASRRSCSTAKRATTSRMPPPVPCGP